VLRSLHDARRLPARDPRPRHVLAPRQGSEEAAVRRLPAERAPRADEAAAEAEEVEGRTGDRGGQAPAEGEGSRATAQGWAAGDQRPHEPRLTATPRRA